jgi:polysaccharide biosynthesis/export protein
MGYKKAIKRLSLAASFIVLIIMNYGCRTYNMMQSRTNTPIDSVLISAVNKYIIRADDKLSMSVWGHDDLSIGSVFGIYNSNEVYGKWVMVDEAGEAVFPKLGKIPVAGLSVNQASEKLKDLYSKTIINPIVVVKVLNKEVSILGEVKTPGKYILEKERNTIFEAIAMAGGVDFYGNIKQVKLVRDNVEHKIDLTASEWVKEKNFIIQPGDVIYIPTKKGKTFDKKIPDVMPIASIITALVIAISYIAK